MKAKGATLQAIADTLNAQRIPTGGTIPGAKWHPSSVSRLLKAAAAAS
jgi:hypothetical protein